jgi:hypothetical protein
MDRGEAQCREAAESGLGLTSALAGFGVAAGARLAVAPFDRGAADEVRESADVVSWTAQRELDGTLRDLFLAGDSLQRDSIDLAGRWLPSSLVQPAAWMRSGCLALDVGRDSLRFLGLDDEGRLAWRELANKLEVFRLVKQVRDRIGVPAPGRPFELPELVARAYELGEFAALWAVEGLGHDFALHRWAESGRDPEGLLSDAAADELPPSSRLMLHAGIGLAFAERLLAELPPDSGPERLADTVERILDLCRRNSRPGDLGAAYESLGLVTRTFHPALVRSVDAALRVLGGTARDFFWHGVGRALYFLPVSFVPWGDVTWRPFSMGFAEAGDEVARRNVVAGIAWALILVNMRQPAIGDVLLLGRHGEIADDEAFTDGAVSTALMRRDTTPGGELLPTYLSYQGGPLWERSVREPSRQALEHEYRALVREDRLGELFRAGGRVAAMADRPA